MAPKVKIESLANDLDQVSKRTMPKRPLDDDQQDQAASQQPATKRARAPLNFSIESIMQSSQQVNHNNNNNTFRQSFALDKNVSRSPSPSSDAGSTGSSRSSGAESRASTLTSRVSENGARDCFQQQQQQHRRQPTHQQHNNLHMSLSLNSLVNNHHAERFVSSCSSNNSSRVSSPISPGCNSNVGSGNQQEGQMSERVGRMKQHQNHTTHQQQIQHNSHHQHQYQNQNHNHQHQQGSLPNGASPLEPQSPPYMGNHGRSHHHQQQAGTSSSGPNHSHTTTTTTTTGSSNTSTGRLNQVECVLDNKDMWDKFHSLNTEMIITKTGRRMFPVLKVQFHNLDPSARYAVSMDIVPVDNKRYRYAYHKSCWQVAGKADPSAEPRLYPHPDSPFNGDLLSRQVISFEKVKLTNNEMDKSGHIILNSMHKYQPRVHLIELKSTLVAPSPQQQQSMQQIPSLNGKLPSSRYQQQHQQQQHRNSCQPQPQLDIEGYRTFVFPETVFTAVTAYQNQLITKMKIDKNPFAKGFRDSSRLSDLDRNDPFEGFMNLGPAAAAAAAAACAAGRYPGGPGGSGPGMPPGSLEAAAAAAGMPPGNPGQMDQAYAQLLASAAAANSPWYSAAAAAAAANANPFGPMGSASACSTAQAAQIQATQMQMWLAAFSACLNNGGQQLNQLPPPPGGPIPNHESLDPTGQLQQECRGDSRSSG